MMASDLTTARWRKSSRSTNTSNCVEVAYAQDAVAVRDSKDPDGPALAVPSAEWGAFLAHAKRGEFDL